MIKKWSIRYPAVGGEEERRAYVYLPTMYEADPDRRYPVLYMFDGQNVFFDEDATLSLIHISEPTRPWIISYAVLGVQ